MSGRLGAVPRCARADPAILSNERDLSEDKTRATLSISNIGDAPIAIEARPAEVGTSEGARYVDTDVLLVVPAIATIEPGERQRLRVGFKGSNALSKDKSLVLLVSTVPPPLPDDEASRGAIAIRSTFVVPVEPCSMRVTDMDLGTYRGEEKELLGEIWLNCEPFTTFRIDLERPEVGLRSSIGSERHQISYKISVEERVTGLRVEKHHNLIRLTGRTGPDRETVIPFKLNVPGRQSVIEGAHLSSFEIELYTY